MKLIVGLGNPGKKYEKTRHNLGFRVLDALAEKYQCDFRANKKASSEIVKTQISSKSILLAKPQTFMNDSGKAVQKLLTTYLPVRQAGNLQLTDLLVVHDEIDLPFGTMKLYGPGGSSAGHKGVDSITQILGYGFTRLRIGIENRKEYRVPETEKYVLQNFTAQEEKKLKTETIPQAIEAIEKFVSQK